MIFFSLILFAGYLIRIWISGFSGFHPDEAYYWAWSLDTRMGYIENPPLIAWMIQINRHLVDALFPNSLMENFPVFFAQLKLRALPYFISSVLIPLSMGFIVESVQRSPLLLSQMFCLLTLPLAFFGPVVVTPDVPFFFAWTLCLGFGIEFQKSRKIKSIAGDPTPVNWRLSTLTGITTAVAFYSGQFAFLIPFLLIVSGIGLRNWLITATVALLFAAPYLHWVWKYPGPLSDLYFLFPHEKIETLLASSQSRGDLWAPYWKTQIVLWNPLIFLACLIYLILDQRRFFLYDQNSRFTGTLFLWSFVPLFVITAFYFKGVVEANWALIGAIPATVLVLARFKFRALNRSLLFLSNLIMVSGALIILIEGKDLAPKIEAWAPDFSARLAKRSRLDEFRNWRNLHLLLHTTIGADTAPIVVPDRQTLASLIFAEESSQSGVKLAKRLRTIVPEDSVYPNFFQRDPDRVLAVNSTERYWYFSKERPKTLSRCRASQSIERIPSETYWLLECNGD